MTVIVLLVKWYGHVCFHINMQSPAQTCRHESSSNHWSVAWSYCSITTATGHFHSSYSSWQQVMAVKVCLFSLQRLSAGVHDWHHNRIHAALPQTGAHPKTLPRYYPFAPRSSLSFLPSLLLSLCVMLLHKFLVEITCIPSDVSLRCTCLCFPLVHICFSHTPVISHKARAPPSGVTAIQTHFQGICRFWKVIKNGLGGY